ncbi:hypothetical protein EDM59_25470 [Brevibacillus nitrificans]|uniref:Uncharacterized protein n=1 Tax=Brevibacillus nitrificans TaxID=651560 RepID=A0A3M8CZ06_9BACL|nr:hypothetical protein [Brevibacillus nitrificans]RNB80669.1 hypothetical protein EDM59_25470 [Brevibacillus nitrificans]
MSFPLFLLLIGVIVMIQPRTKRWQSRMEAHFKGNEKRIKQRANTFYLLGFAFLMAGFAYLYQAVASS